MQISALKKLLQLIKNSESLEEVKSSEATSEQETENNLVDVDEEMQEIGTQSDEMQSEEMQSEEMQSEEMQNAERRMQNTEATVNHAENNRSHLTSSVPRAAKAPIGTLTKGELAEIRALFTNLDDAEIQRLYKKVTK